MWDDEQTARQERAARLTIDLLVEMTTVLFDKAAAYTSLVMLGGYAGIFSIWAFVNEGIDPRARLWVALLLMVSIVAFVAYEVYKMIFSAIQTYSLSALLNVPRTPEQMLEAFQEHQNRQKQSSSMPLQIGIWLLFLGIAVAAAVGALILLGGALVIEILKS